MIATSVESGSNVRAMFQETWHQFDVRRRDPLRHRLLRCPSKLDLMRLQELVSRQVAAASPASQDPPTSVAPALTVAVAPATAPNISAATPIASGSLGLDPTALEAEQERSLAMLAAFKWFNPPTFDGR
uniref:Uncharacterized protein n=1 Tax=Ananas comosus var. bracteatus TaxID=296719 RepID=A0A6V7Q9D0_ANACO|nr:unnamed protein product [Ananas comosus var. bracteatus]